MTAAPLPEAAHGPRAGVRHVVLATLFAGLLAPLNSTMIVVALPSMLDELGGTLAAGNWVVLSYLVVMAAIQPLGGSLGDRYGQRRLVLFGLVGFLIASVGAAFAPNLELLVAARTVQGVSGAIAIPNATALVRILVPGPLHGRSFGLIGAGFSLSAALGPPLGGIVTETLGWRWMFAANVPVVIIGLALVAALPASLPRARTGRFDLSGAALLLVGLVSAALAATLWRVPEVPIALSPLLAVVAVAAAVVLPRHVARTRHPVLQLGLLGRPGFLPAGLTVAASNLTMYTIFLAVPVYLATQVGWGARDTGLLLAGMSILMAVTGPLGGWAADRFGSRPPALFGSALAVLGVVPLTLLDPSWSWVSLLIPMTVVGAGIGLSSAPIMTAAMRAAEAEEAGQAAGLYSTMRYAGSITGSALMAGVIGDAAALSSFHLLFLVVVAAAVAASISASRLPGKARLTGNAGPATLARQR